MQTILNLKSRNVDNTNMQNIIHKQNFDANISINITGFLHNDILMKYQDRSAKSYMWGENVFFFIGVRVAAVYAMFEVGKIIEVLVLSYSSNCYH